MNKRRLLGAVLAGGRSRRYGQPKHAVPVGGTPMIERALAALEAVVEAVVVVVASGSVDGVDDAHTIVDRLPGKGPLGGLHAALHRASELGMDGVVLLACDLPLVDARVISALAGEEGRLLAPLRGGSGIQPLCAVYETSLLPMVEERLGGGDLSLHALFREAGGRTVELGEGSFTNVNTPADRAQAEAELREISSS